MQEWKASEKEILRRLLLSLTDSLPKTLVSGYSYHRASIKHYYIITFYLKKPDLFYNSFHLIIPSKIPNAILRTTDIRLIAENTLVSFRFHLQHRHCLKLASKTLCHVASTQKP